jgi:hypothetical protein
MSTFPDTLAQTQAGFLPVNPYTSVSYHFGMLLGVDDFETEQGYHRGKQALHNAWLHREGVVWGLGVETDLESGEIRVTPGLAQDGAGNQFHLELPACLDVGRWWVEARRGDPAFPSTERPGGGVSIDVEVAARFRACLTRPVPALSQDCEGADSETAYSRAAEAIDIFLRPVGTTAPAPPYRRLRLLLGIDADPADPDDVEDEVIGARAAAADGPALVAAFRRFAALDALELAPVEDDEGRSSRLFPALEGEAIPLATIHGLELEPRGDEFELVGPGVTDQTVRSVLVATAAIQELLCARPAPAPGGGGGGVAPADAGGPRVDRPPDSADGRAITIGFDKQLDPASVDNEAFRVSTFDTSGWVHRRVTRAAYDDVERTVTLRLRVEAEGQLVRVIAFGTGTNPLLGIDHIPLAGSVGGPPGSAAAGIDFVHHITTPNL